MPKLLLLRKHVVGISGTNAPITPKAVALNPMPEKIYFFIFFIHHYVRPINLYRDSLTAYSAENGSKDMSILQSQIIYRN